MLIIAGFAIERLPLTIGTMEGIRLTDCMILAHCAIGLAAAQIARRKGEDLAKWLILGAIGGTLALVVVMFLRPRGLVEKD